MTVYQKSPSIDTQCTKSHIPWVFECKAFMVWEVFGITNMIPLCIWFYEARTGLITFKTMRYLLIKEWMFVETWGQKRYWKKPSAAIKINCPNLLKQRPPFLFPTLTATDLNKLPGAIIATQSLVLILHVVWLSRFWFDHNFPVRILSPKWLKSFSYNKSAVADTSKPTL